jgi:hypothetical protein
MPLINLSAIQADSSSQLELIFKSIQTAVGGKGLLKANFDSLAQKILLHLKSDILWETIL